MCALRIENYWLLLQVRDAIGDDSCKVKISLSLIENYFRTHSYRATVAPAFVR